MHEELNLSDSELVVMRVIWSLGQADADQISELLNESYRWAGSTIKTFLARLVKKGLLTTTKSGHKFIYNPTRTEDEAIEQMTQEFLRKVCARKHKQVIVRMIEVSDFTEADKVEVGIAILKKSTVEEVQCDCLDNQQYCAC